MPDHNESKHEAALKRLEALRSTVIVGDIHAHRWTNNGRAMLTICDTHILLFWADCQN
ncbi:MAG: hypothetical protein M0Q44_21850 [Methylobacter sp.]|nr:hypothetical protein [Methylobacter sp.]